MYGKVVWTTLPIVEPPGGQCHDRRVIRVEFVFTFRRSTTITTFLQPVDNQGCFCTLGPGGEHL
ncbi:hypothetical protein RchiOBHm_Chr1g0340901 [Rosa chinensis]|uniref:Uncharacterized protein n=1 Tax=Rosa chinensis TaxID=74649 RepID=A0A2P6SDL0_ROSCH|nr:hypothetical protein RchiOBHm_Chr1g0340901 [Rosa chinensis]